MSNKSEHHDLYALAVLRKLDQLLDEPLSSNQRAKLEQALSACKPKMHTVDFRGELPLHFARLYYVFLMGLDRRSEAQTVESDLRRQKGPLAHILYWLVALWPLYIVIYFVYFLMTNMPKLI